MKLSWFAATTVVALGIQAAGAPYAPAKPAASSGATGTIEKSLQISPAGLAWGMSLAQIAKLYDKVIADEMLPLFRKAQPGMELDALNEEMKERQGALRRGRIEFGNLPTGVDQSALKGEYSYGNGESMAWLTLPSGTKRNFFFINDRLWKIYDEHKLKKGGGLGENFQEAVKALAKRFGAAPKMNPADYEKGRPFDEAEWHDPDKQIRAVDRGQTLGVVYTERKVLENIAQYRKNQTTDGPEAIDRDVAAVTKGPAEPPKSNDKDKSKSKKK